MTTSPAHRADSNFDERDLFDLKVRVVLSRDEISPSRPRTAETHQTECGTCPGVDC